LLSGFFYLCEAVPAADAITGKNDSKFFDER
jgi:hypothetical protein